MKMKDLILLYIEHKLPKRNKYHNRGGLAKESESETLVEYLEKINQTGVRK